MAHKVRFVVPTLGKRVDWLHLMLRSVSNQGVDVDLVMVGPDTPELHEIALEYGARFEVESGSSLSSAINQGVAALEQDSEFVAWLGDDDVLAPGALQAALRALEGEPEAPFCYGRLRYIDEAGRSKWLARPGRWAVPYARWGVNFVPQPGSVIRRSAWNEVGGLDESLHNAMDHDLFLKLAALSSGVYVPRELASFRVHGGSISVRKDGQSESDLVRSRYQPALGYRSAGIVRLVVMVTNRILLSVHSRIPGPTLPLVNESHYFSSAYYA